MQRQKSGFLLEGTIRHGKMASVYCDYNIYGMLKEDYMKIDKFELLDNLDKLHTTELGGVRIKRNLSLDTDEVVAWCKEKINSDNAVITRNGKNWYVSVDACIITVNAYSYTIITAHKEKNRIISGEDEKK